MKIGIFTISMLVLLAISFQALAEPTVLGLVKDCDGCHESYVISNHSAIYCIDDGIVKPVAKTTSVTAIICVLLPEPANNPLLLFANSSGIYSVDVDKESLGCGGEPSNNPPWRWKFGKQTLVKKATSVTGLAYRHSGYDTEISFINATGLYTFKLGYNYGRSIEYGEPKLISKF